MRNILFDVDGVLIHGYHAREDLRRCWDENLTQDLGICRERFKTEFIFGPFIKEVITGKTDLHDALSQALPTLGYTDDAQTVIDYWLKNDSHINTYLIEKVKMLKNSGKVRLFIATNQEHTRAAYLMKELGVEKGFEDIFHSDRIGIDKPDPAYYAHVSNLLPASTMPPIFFDDTPAVVEGARAHGWDAYAFNGIENLNDSDFVRGILSAV